MILGFVIDLLDRVMVDLIVRKVVEAFPEGLIEFLVCSAFEEVDVIGFGLVEEFIVETELFDFLEFLDFEQGSFIVEDFETLGYVDNSSGGFGLPLYECVVVFS